MPPATSLGVVSRASATAMFAVFTACCCGETSAAQPASEAPRHAASGIRALTGARTRVVWCQDMGDGSDTFARGHAFRLMGYDSDDGLGERAILGKLSNYSRPIITPGGDRVIFSTRGSERIFIVNWDGTGLRELADGLAVAAWINPEDGNEWVFAGTRIHDSQTVRDLRRFPIADPARVELAWTMTAVEADNAQVSDDGFALAGAFPWPDCGIAELPNAGWRKYARGCWPSIAPDGIGLFWVFDGAHRNLTLFDLSTGARWTLGINNAPGIEGHEVYHPRWSNHARIMAMTGPYTVGASTNRIRSGGTNVEIFLGRFAEDFTTIERWARLTHNERADFYPDVWVQKEPRAKVVIMKPKAAAPAPEQAARRRPCAEIIAPGPTAKESGASKDAESRPRLVVEAQLMEASVIPAPEAIAPYRRALAANPYKVLRVLEGKLSGEKVLIAHWVIRDGLTLESAQRVPGQVCVSVLEPFDSRPELEGERLIMDTDQFSLPMYYEVEQLPRREPESDP